MEETVRTREKGRWRALLSIALTAALALCMTPAGALEAHAASKTKSYVYNYVYGTYQDEYAIGFKYEIKGKVEALKDELKEIDIISATKGVTLRIKASDLGKDRLDHDLITADGFLSFTWGRCPGVIAVPFKSGGKIVAQPYSLEGRKLSSTKYQQVNYFGGTAEKGGAVFSRESGSSFVADVYNSEGKKTQTISAALPERLSGSWTYIEENADGVYYCINLSSESRSFETLFYQFKNGKFVKCSNPWKGENEVGGGVELVQSRVLGAHTYRAYLVQPDGRRIELPASDDLYEVLCGVGVSAMDEKGVVSVYGKQGSLIKAISTGGASSSASWRKSAVPNIWVLSVDRDCYAAYDSSFKEVSRSLAFRYQDAISVGEMDGKAIYLTKLMDDTKSYANSLENGVYVDSLMTPIKIKGHALVGGYYDRHKTPIHTFSNGRSIVVAKNSKGKYGVLDTSGNVLVPFSYSSYYNVGGGDYIMMKASKGWQFVKVSQFASGKAVKGITYTVGKLKYKVTSTSSKNRTATVVGHVSGTKAKGRLSIPSTVKIGGQKFKVTAVGSSAFKKSQITSVTAGSYVTTVGTNAFASCKSLKTVTLGKKVKTLGKSAFANDKKLSKITIKSKSLKSVGKGAIKGISKKSKIKVPSSKVKTYKKLFKASTGFKKSMKVTK